MLDESNHRRIVIQANISLLKFYNKNTRKRCELCSNLTKKYQSDVNGVVLVFLSLTLNIFLEHITFSSVFIVEFEQVNVCWDRSFTAKNMKFSIKDFFSKFSIKDFFTFTEEILYGKTLFLCSVSPWTQNVN